MPTWTSPTLPKLGLVDGTDEQDDNALVEFDTEKGPPRRRKIISDPGVLFQLQSQPMTPTQRLALLDFFRDDCERGALSFDMAHPIEETVMEWQFVSAPAIRLVGIHFIANLQLRIMPGGAVTLSEANIIRGSLLSDSMIIRDTITPSNIYDGVPAAKLTYTGANGTRFNSLGILTPAVTNVPRIDHDPVTFAVRGLMIEESRTNSLRNNSMIGAVAGTPGTVPTNWALVLLGTTQTIVGIGTESGLTYLEFRISGTPSSTGVLEINLETSTGIVAASGNVWTNSAFVSLVSGGFTNVGTIKLGMDENTAAGAYIADGQGSDIKASITSSLARFSFARTLVGGGTVARVRPYILIGLTSGLAVDFTVRIGLPQMELGAFASSVIITTGSAVTRDADVPFIPATLFPLSQYRGTLYVQARPMGLSSFSPIIHVTDASAGTEFHGIQRNGTDPRAFTKDGGVTQTSLDSGTWAADTVCKLAYSYALNDFSLVSDGGTPATDASGTLPVVDRITLGCDGAGLNQANIWLQEFMYIPRDMTNAEKQELTT